MKNLVIILGLITLVAFAENKGGGGGDKGGRGVGGGYGGHLIDIFSTIAFDTDSVADESGVEIEGPTSAQDFIGGSSVSATIDTQAIIDFVENGNVIVAEEGSVFVPVGVSYTISDGQVYLNKRIWDDRAKQKQGIEIEVLRVLLKATNQEDPNGAVSKFYGEKIIRLNGTRTLEFERDALSSIL
ncbi:MAG: hypothetical protein R3A80_11325 [Bdellovibrionota bacterium]